MNQPASIGHNQGPEMSEIIAGQMAQRYADELQEMENLIAKKAQLPEKIENDDDAGKYADYIKRVTAKFKGIDAIRKTEKEEWSAKANAVHAFFKKKMDVLEGVKSVVNEPLGRYLQAKEDEKRRKAAEKAEEERLAAVEAKRIADEAAAEAKRLKEEADAETARIERENEEKRIEAEKAAQKIKDDAAAAAQKIIDDANAAALAATDDAKTIVKEAKSQAAEIVKTANVEAKTIVTETKQEIKAAEGDIKELHKEARDADRESSKLGDQAHRQEKFADKVEKTVFAKSSDLSRTRGDASLASVSEKWVGEVADRSILDLEALRDHIPFAALNQAVQSWVNANKENRTLRGAHISQDVKTTVR